MSQSHNNNLLVHECWKQATKQDVLFNDATNWEDDVASVATRPTSNNFTIGVFCDENHEET